MCKIPLTGQRPSEDLVHATLEPTSSSYSSADWQLKTTTTRVQTICRQTKKTGGGLSTSTNTRHHLNQENATKPYGSRPALIGACEIRTPLLDTSAQQELKRWRDGPASGPRDISCSHAAPNPGACLARVSLTETMCGRPRQPSTSVHSLVHTR